MKNVNIKVVVLWLFFIVLFGGLGLFGYLNRDIIEDLPDDKSVYQPKVNSKIVYNCVTTLDRGNVSYKFLLNETNLINSLQITYISNTKTSSNEDIDDYTHAANLSNMDVDGIDTIINGSIGDFSLQLFVNINAYNENTLASSNSELSALNILITKETNYESYSNLLSAAYPNTTCSSLNN